MAVGSSVAVDRSTAGFSGTTQTAGTVAAAASFSCSAGSQTVLAEADNYVDESASTTNYGTSATLWAQTSNMSSRRRTFVRFPLPTIPSGCAVTAATMTLSTISSTAGRTLVVEQVTQSWDEATQTWSNQPAVTSVGSTSAASANSSVSWTVTSIVQAQYAGTNDGVRINDSAENDAFGLNSFSATTPATGDEPRLQVSWS